MVEIRVPPERLRSAASALDSQQQEIDSVLQNMVTTVNNLQGEWTGLAQVDYAQSFNDQVPVMRMRLDETLEHLVSDLRRIADEFERVDQQLVGSPATGGIAAAVGAAVAAVGSATAGAQGAPEPQGDEPLTEFPYTPGVVEPSHQAGGCVLQARQRSGGRLKNCPDGWARSLPDAYPPDKKLKLTSSADEGDLRQSGIQPGMAMVWQPGEKMYPNQNQQGYTYAVRADSTGGHVAIVEEVGADYVIVSDNHGSSWRIDQHVTYWENRVQHTENFLPNATFIDLT
jgi:WXG100 family type VII secretion target